ncbi:hypothetical protein [Natronococcus sp. A-GB7]|uniref:hypothetical protein n=1 Tax=Natronococcus sp. A-GB7 TaxID=3037649 RepID=UPI00241CA809|nr:hypothetical protein [Natronococcus sp. A-GB7]MDG5821926.1 hypothetical protein [Natronococcus sp. A-GB7]
MTKDLVDKAREIGGDALAGDVEKLVNHIESEYEEQPLDQQLREYVDYDDSTLNSMDTEDKKSLLEKFENAGKKKTNVEIPVAGRTNSENTSVELEQSDPDTYTKEVEIPGPGRNDDDPATVTEEYAREGPSMEDLTNWRGEMHHRFAEENRRQQERANRRREEQESRSMPTRYTNTDEVEGDVDSSEIPAPGQRDDDE